ncbi:MAG: CTP synthase [Blastocatellia bacterium]|nr:CTP synthase [Blastocatellia bacterium]
MERTLKVGIIADYDPDFRPHRKANEVLTHSAKALSAPLEASWLPTEELTSEASLTRLEKFDALWCGPGSPYKSLQGALNAIRFARERDYPFIGTCAGFQHIVLEYAINVLGIEDAASEEYNPDGSKLFISRLACSVAGKTLKIKVKPDTLARATYGRQEINEHYYCNFGLNPAFQSQLEAGGLKVSGIDDDGEARILELRDRRFFIATLFVPQLFEENEGPHPLIVAYLEAAMAFHASRHGRDGRAFEQQDLTGAHNEKSAKQIAENRSL